MLTALAAALAAIVTAFAFWIGHAMGQAAVDVARIKREAISEFSRRGARVSNGNRSKARKAERQRVLDTAAQMRLDMEAKAING